MIKVACTSHRSYGYKQVLVAAFARCTMQGVEVDSREGKSSVRNPKVHLVELFNVSFGLLVRNVKRLRLSTKHIKSWSVKSC